MVGLTGAELQRRPARLVDAQAQRGFAQVQPDGAAAAAAAAREVEGQQQPRPVPRAKLERHRHARRRRRRPARRPRQPEEALGAGERHGDENGLDAGKGHIALRQMERRRRRGGRHGEREIVIAK